MNFPILSAIILIPLIGAFFIFITRGNQKNVEKNSKYVAIFSSITNFIISLFLWFSFDTTTSDFQFVEEKKWIEDFIDFQLGIDSHFNNGNFNVRGFLFTRFGNFLLIFRRWTYPYVFNYRNMGRAKKSILSF